MTLEIRSRHGPLCAASGRTRISPGLRGHFSRCSFRRRFSLPHAWRRERPRPGRHTIDHPGSQDANEQDRSVLLHGLIGNRFRPAIPDGKQAVMQRHGVLAARVVAVTAESQTGDTNMAADRSGSLSGLTEQEAREFHGIFMASFIGFVVVAIIAHFLVWQWRPWLPGPKGYAALARQCTMRSATSSRL